MEKFITGYFYQERLEQYRHGPLLAEVPERQATHLQQRLVARKRATVLDNFLRLMFTDSIALVVQITSRISISVDRNSSISASYAAVLHQDPGVGW